jgi:phenylalanyl-tRNA synthetase beta chain
MARRLHLAGMRPINNVVDITNYVMLEWGQPLHAFDYDRLVARAGGARPTVIVRRARAGERMTTLDDVTRPLDEDTLLICDQAGPVAMAGVMGGADSEVTGETTSVLIESASFEFINIRRTSKVQRLPSESSARFGRGVHPALTEAGSLRSAALLRDLAGGRPVAGVVDAYPRPPATVKLALDQAQIQRVLGAPIPLGTARAILERLEFGVTEGPGALTVTVPPHRMDVSLPADLVEEVARVYGYDRLPSTLLADRLPPQRDNNRLRFEEAARDALVVAGLQEIISYRLVSAEREADLRPDRHADPTLYVTLANPVSPERASLRRSILTGLLEAAVGNLRFTDRLAAFEVGPVFVARPAGLPDEPRRLGVLMVGPLAERSWRAARGSDMDFYHAKGAVEALLAHLGTADVGWSTGSHVSMHPGRTAVVRSGALPLGHVGELHPLVLENWGLADRVVAVADLDLDAIQQASSLQTAFVPFSQYPPVRQDLAVVVPRGMPAADVAAVIRSSGGPLLAHIELFDVYRGPQVGSGRKSLAWALTFQAPDRTLESREADQARAGIAAALAARLQAEVREQ